MNDWKLHLGTVLIEVTDKCNMDCPHCMRYEVGEDISKYNNFMDKEIIDLLFENISIIDNLYFTGGEPLLNAELIKYTLRKIIDEKINVITMGISTNGTILDDEIPKLFNEFANSREDKYKMMLKDSYKIPCEFRISTTFHNNEDIVKRANDFYKDKFNDGIFRIACNHSIEEYLKDIKQLKYSGRAKKIKGASFTYGSGHHKVTLQNKKGYPEIKENLCILHDGGITIAEGDESFVSMKKETIGNIKKTPILSMLEEWNYRTPLTEEENYKLTSARALLEQEDYENDYVKKYIEDTALFLEGLEDLRIRTHRQYPNLLPVEIERFTNDITKKIQENDELGVMLIQLNMNEINKSRK